MIDLAIDALAAHRLTRLVTKDTITRPARAAVIEAAYVLRDGHVTVIRTDSELDELPHYDDDPPAIAAFIICPWCVGFWISGFVVIARRYAAVLWDPIARGLATSTVVGLLAGHEVEA